MSVPAKFPLFFYTEIKNRIEKIRGNCPEQTLQTLCLKSRNPSDAAPDLVAVGPALLYPSFLHFGIECAGCPRMPYSTVDRPFPVSLVNLRHRQSAAGGIKLEVVRDEVAQNVAC